MDCRHDAHREHLGHVINRHQNGDPDQRQDVKMRVVSGIEAADARRVQRSRDGDVGNVAGDQRITSNLEDTADKEIKVVILP